MELIYSPTSSPPLDDIPGVSTKSTSPPPTPTTTTITTTSTPTSTIFTNSSTPAVATTPTPTPTPTPTTRTIAPPTSSKATSIPILSFTTSSSFTKTTTTIPIITLTSSPIKTATTTTTTNDTNPKHLTNDAPTPTTEKPTASSVTNLPTTTDSSTTIETTTGAAVMIPTSSLSSNPVPSTSNCGRIPKISQQNEDVFKRKSEMTPVSLIEAQTQHRILENQLKILCKDRNDLERKMNDLARSASGKNIELDPHFRQMKEQKIVINREIHNCKNGMDKVSKFLLDKYNYKVISQVITIDNGRKNPHEQKQLPKRARMSTSGDQTKLYKEKNVTTEEKVMFDFAEDTNPYCTDCKILFPSATEYCQHLHKREHAMNVMKVFTPWRSHKEVIDKKKTYDFMKSMMAKVNQESGCSFSFTDLDKVLTPNLSKEEYKCKSLERERGRFDKNDVLFDPKGYNYLLPVTGYFCTLCQKTLCDMPEVNLHVRGYEHNYAYMKSVALNPLLESSYRHQLVDAHRNKYGVEIGGTNSFKRLTNITTGSSSNGSKERNNSKSLTFRNNNQPIEDPRRESSRPKVSIPNRQMKPPEIVALSKSNAKPSALKRLRTETSENVDKSALKPPIKYKEHESSEETKKPNQGNEVVEVSDNEDAASAYFTNDEEDISELIVINIGDPDSPYPDLEINLNGNNHMRMLADQKLKQKLKVSMKKLDLSEHKDMMTDPDSLWERMDQYVLKTEKPSFVQEKLFTDMELEAIFFRRNGELEPIDLEDTDTSPRKKRIKSERRDRHNSGSDDVDAGTDKVRVKDRSDEFKARGASSSASDLNAKKGDQSSDKKKGEISKSKEESSNLKDSRDGSISPLSLPGTPENGEINLNFLYSFFLD